MIIGKTDTTKEILIVAEIGNNHEGSFALAEELIGLAAETGVQAVKFQTFKTEYYVSNKDVDRFKRLKSFELKYSEFEKLSKLANSLGLAFMSTPFDLDSADFLNTIVAGFKIASGDNNFYPLLRKVSEFGKPTIMSSGLADINQLEISKNLIESTWKEKGFIQELAILHCVSSYPVPLEEANLGAIKDIASHLKCTVGYSDHTLGIDAALLSLTQGARIIEKHFTINKNYSNFRDHQLSADPQDLKLLVQKVKSLQNDSDAILKSTTSASAYIGKGLKNLQQSEVSNLSSMRRSIAARHHIPAGKVIEYSDLTWIRPGTGFAPGKEYEVVGKIAAINLELGDLILHNSLKN